MHALTFTMLVSLLLCCVATQAPGEPAQTTDAPLIAAPKSAEATDWRAAIEALAPSYVRWDGGAPDADVIPGLLRQLLVQQVISRDSAEGEREFQRAVARITPNLTERDCDQLLMGLADQRWRDVETAQSMLLEAPVSESRGILLRWVLDDQYGVAGRADAAQRLLAADGRVALESIRSLLAPDTEAVLLRRIYRAWRTMLTPEDLPILEQLVEEGPGLLREFALQTWASAETDPDKRVRILRLSEASGNDYRSMVVRELATRGGDEAVNEYMRTLFDAPRPEDRRLARQFGALFLGEDAVIDQWEDRGGASMNYDLQGQWMLDLARLPSEQAKRIATEWFLDRGAVESRYSLGLGRILAQSDALDPSLSKFLRNQDVKIALRVQVASLRAPHSADARNWLREELPATDGILALQLVRGLGSGKSARDIPLLEELADDSQREPIVRTEAIRSLAKLPTGEEALYRLLNQFAERGETDFEPLELLVELSARAPFDKLRARAIELAEAGFNLEDAEERRAIQTAAWRGQGFAPRESEAQSLREHAERELFSLPTEDPLIGWGSPREMRSHARELAILIVALAGSSAAAVDLPPVQHPDGQPTSWRARYLWAEAAMRAAPRASMRVASQLAADARLLRSNRVRALGLCAQAARRAAEFEAELSALSRIGNLLREPDSEQDLFDLALGMGLSSPRAWIIPGDEIGQQMLLAEARSIDVGRANVLEGMLSGGCQTSVLLEAAQLLADADSWSASLRFSERASDFEPANVEARWLQGRAWEELGLLEDAELAYGAAVRLGGTNAALAEDAKERLQAIAELDR